jgi:hypothetical protein
MPSHIVYAPLAFENAVKTLAHIEVENGPKKSASLSLKENGCSQDRSIGLVVFCPHNFKQHYFRISAGTGTLHASINHQ